MTKQAKILLNILMLTVVSCNFSDQVVELPIGYKFAKEGGYSNIVTRNGKLIIDRGAVEYSFNTKYIFFSQDTSKSMEPQNVAKSKLVYYIHDIENDTLSKALNISGFRKFIQTKKVRNIIDISKMDR